MYDAIAESVPLAQTGQHRKRAVVLISDGNDTDSQVSLSEVKQLIRESEVMVYAIGIDGQAEDVVRLPADDARADAAAADAEPVPRRTPSARSRRRHSSADAAVPVAVPAGRRGAGRCARATIASTLNALREITDDSGGRTEIVRSGRDLEPATANIADELSQQYYLGYSSTTKKDGRWHSIRVETRDKSLRVRARRGYVATP